MDGRGGRGSELAPYPVDAVGKSNTNASRTWRFDRVLANPSMEASRAPTVTGTHVFPDGLVFDSRTFTQAELTASFPPVLATDSGAVSMGHMAVVRDFAILP